MNLKEKVKSYSFWVSLASAVVLILKVIGSNFGFTIDATLAGDLITSLCSVLVIFGIIVTPTPKTSQINEIIKKETSIVDSVENLIVNQPIESKVLENNYIFENTEPNSTPTNESLTQEVQTEYLVECDNTFNEVNYSNTENKFEDNSTELNNTFTIQTEINSCDIESFDYSDELKKIFLVEKEKFKNNITAYIELLENEINNTKNNIG